MIHFRLRRFFRLAVDLLSLNFARSFIGPCFAAFILRANHTNAFAVLHASDLTAFGSHSRSPSIHSSLRSVNLRSRRYFAFSGLLIALSLEVCGCDLARDFGVTLGPLAMSMTASETVSPEPELSFYDPADSTIDSTLAQSTGNDRLLGIQAQTIETRPLPWAIPESVYFLYRGHLPGERPAGHPSTLRPQQPLATAFVLSVPDRNHNRFDRFLVTARHVVDPQWAHCSEQNPDSINLRLNRRTGGVGYETVPLQSGAVRRFYTSSDPTIDLAVIPLDPTLIANLSDYKFIDIPFRLLPTDFEMRLIRADQQVMTATLSARPADEPDRYPVFDAGSLSNILTEAVGVRCGIALGPQSPAKLLHVWFISAGISQGVSGAPVYTSIARGPGVAKTPVLLGIQSVAWPDKGVAGITPSTALGDLIQSTLHKSKLHLDFYRGPTP